MTRSRLLRWAFPLLQPIRKKLNSLKDILQIIWTLLGPLFKGPVPSAWYQKIGPVILYISCSTTVQKFLSVLEIYVQVIFRSRTCNPLKGPGRKKKLKGAYCSELYSEQLLFCNALQNICCFRDIRGQRFEVLVP